MIKYSGYKGKKIVLDHTPINRLSFVEKDVIDPVTGKKYKAKDAIVCKRMDYSEDGVKIVPVQFITGEHAGEVHNFVYIVGMQPHNIKLEVNGYTLHVDNIFPKVTNISKSLMDKRVNYRGEYCLTKDDIEEFLASKNGQSVNK